MKTGAGLTLHISLFLGIILVMYSGTGAERMDVLVDTKKRLSEVERELGLDWRLSYSSLEVEDEWKIILELSREDVFRAFKDEPPSGMRVASSGEDSFVLVDAEGRKVEVRLLKVPSQSVLLVVSSVADLRREPEHASELLSQAVMGESLEELKRKGDWLLCRFEDGYTGWVRSWYVKRVDVETAEDYKERCNSMVVANVGYVYSEPSDGSLPMSEAVSGTRLHVQDCKARFCRVELPIGRYGFIKEKDVEMIRSGLKPSAEGIVRRALHFLGIPYLWGGTSAKGFDCSGLIKRVFSMEGVSLPRDSDMMAKIGKLIPLERLEETRKGDLLFFGEGQKVSHVALYLGDGKFLHAYGEVKINSLSADSADYDEKLAGSLLFARRIL